MNRYGWIGVDFDGTLAEYNAKDFPTLGKPIPAMVDRVKKWLAEGIEVRIVTARVADVHFYHGGPEYDQAMHQDMLISMWCREHIGQPLVVTAVKDYRMLELWDDRAVTVEKNTGRVLTEGK